MRVTDIEIVSYGDGARMWLKLGALRVRLTLDARSQRALAAALIGLGRNELSAEVDITPLRLPSHIHELTEVTLNCREVDVQRQA